MPSTAEQRPSGSAPVLALDLGGTHLRTAVVAVDGTLTVRQRIRSPMAAGADAVVTAATDQLRATLSEHVAGGGRAPVALDIIARALRAFAAAIVSIVNLFDPDRIIVGGGIAMVRGERLLAPARDAVAAHAFRVQASRVRIVPTALGDDVALVGILPLVAFAV